jgi:hypothetical protein
MRAAYGLEPHVAPRRLVAKRAAAVEPTAGPLFESNAQQARVSRRGGLTT